MNEMPVIIITSIGMPTDGSIGSASISVYGNGVGIETTIIMDKTSSDNIHWAIRRWQAANGIEIPSAEMCVCSGASGR